MIARPTPLCLFVLNLVTGVVLGCDASSPRGRSACDQDQSGRYVDVETCAIRTCLAANAMPCATQAEALERAEDLDGLVSLYEETCRAGHRAGCMRAAIVLAVDEGVWSDPKLASALYERACALGHDVACTLQGFPLALLGPTDDDRAAGRSLLVAKCKTDDMLACTGLMTTAFNLERGEQVEPDQALAATLHVVACEHGEAGSCEQLGFMVDEGRGLPHDDEVALDYYRRACEMDIETACDSFEIMQVKQALKYARRPASLSMQRTMQPARCGPDASPHLDALALALALAHRGATRWPAHPTCSRLFSGAWVV